MSSVLLVAPQGLLEVLQSDRPIEARSWLEDHGSGQYVALAIHVGEQDGGRVEFLVDPAGPMNPRARTILARLTGVHVILTGNVAFTGLDPEVVVEMIREVG